MKKISFIVPCYNEELNVRPISEAIIHEMQINLQNYDYEIIFIDNKSLDTTRNKIKELCCENKKIKAIFNVRNFGQFNSPYHALCQSTGDCTILLCADFQDPVELIPNMIKEWENGAPVVCMVKTKSKENGFMYFLRSLYYKSIQKLSQIKQIEHFTGFGCYDRKFIDILRQLNDPTPFLRGIVAEYAPEHVEIEYEQQRRRTGKTSNNFFSLFDAAMLSFTSYTKGGLRFATFAGFLLSGGSLFVSLIYLVMKLCFWNTFLAGSAPIVIGVFFLGGVQLFFIGLLGEYIMSMNSRVINRPLVIEERRINF